MADRMTVEFFLKNERSATYGMDTRRQPLILRATDATLMIERHELRCIWPV